jgi:hypothetical protein
MAIKVIKNHRIPPLLYKKNYYKQPFYLAMFGILGWLIFFVKLVCSEVSDNIEFTQNDFIGFGIFGILFLMFMQSSLILYISSTLFGIIESIVNDNEPEQKSLSENE